MQVENRGIKLTNSDQSFGSRIMIEPSRMHALTKTLEYIYTSTNTIRKREQEIVFLFFILIISEL
jgi:hypothetical protein